MPSRERVLEPAASLRALRTWCKRILFPVTERDRARRRVVALISPFATIALFGGVLPLVQMFRTSVSEEQFDIAGFTLDPYRTLLDPWYVNIAFNTLLFAAVTTVVSVALGVALAHALEKYDLPAENLMLTLISFPNSLPGIVVAFMIIVLFGNTGMITRVISVFAGAEPTSVAIATTIFGLFLGYLYTMVSRATLLLRGTYAELNTDAEEAARSLGASPLETFYYVTLPQIKPGVIGAIILDFRTALEIFGTVLVLRALRVWTLQINDELGTGFNIQTASAMGILMFLFVSTFTVLTVRYTSAEVTI